MVFMLLFNISLPNYPLTDVGATKQTFVFLFRIFLNLPEKCKICQSPGWRQERNDATDGDPRLYIELSDIQGD